MQFNSISEFFVVPGEMGTPLFEQTEEGCKFVFYLFLNGLTDSVGNLTVWAIFEGYATYVDWIILLIYYHYIQCKNFQFTELAAVYCSTPDDKIPWSPKKLFDDSFDGYETNGPQWYKVAISVDDWLDLG